MVSTFRFGGVGGRAGRGIGKVRGGSSVVINGPVKISTCQNFSYCKLCYTVCSLFTTHTKAINKQKHYFFNLCSTGKFCFIAAGDVIFSCFLAQAMQVYVMSPHVLSSEHRKSMMKGCC